MLHTALYSLQPCLKGFPIKQLLVSSKTHGMALGHSETKNHCLLFLSPDRGTEETHGVREYSMHTMTQTKLSLKK